MNAMDELIEQAMSQDNGSDRSLAVVFKDGERCIGISIHPIDKGSPYREKTRVGWMLVKKNGTSVFFHSNEVSRVYTWRKDD